KCRMGIELSGLALGIGGLGIRKPGELIEIIVGLKNHCGFTLKRPFALFCFNDNDAIGGPKSIKRRRCRTFQHIYRFDIIGIDVNGPASARDRKSVNNIQGFIVAYERSATPNGDLRTASWSSGTLLDNNSSYFSLQAIGEIGIAHSSK